MKYRVTAENPTRDRQVVIWEDPAASMSEAFLKAFYAGIDRTRVRDDSYLVLYEKRDGTWFEVESIEGVFLP